MYNQTCCNLWTVSYVTESKILFGYRDMVYQYQKKYFVTFDSACGKIMQSLQTHSVSVSYSLLMVKIILLFPKKIRMTHLCL